MRRCTWLKKKHTHTYTHIRYVQGQTDNNSQHIWRRRCTQRHTCSQCDQSSHDTAIHSCCSSLICCHAGSYILCRSHQQPTSSILSSLPPHSPSLPHSYSLSVPFNTLSALHLCPEFLPASPIFSHLYHVGVMLLSAFPSYSLSTQLSIRSLYHLYCSLYPLLTCIHSRPPCLCPS